MRCNDRSSLRFVRLAVLAAVAVSCGAKAAVACPFCTPVGPSLTQRIDEADRALVAECVAAQAPQVTLEPRHDLKDKSSTDPLMLDAAVFGSASAPVGSLWLLLGENGDDEQLRWQATPLNETSFAYLARAPRLRVPEPERLRYFASYLQHADPLLAEDAYLEFARAPFDAVAAAAASIDMPKVRHWLASRDVPDARKGLYGLMLGLAIDDQARAANRALLLETIDRAAREQTTASGGDFRPGFDGVLGGLIALDHVSALDLIDQQFLDNPNAAEGHLRHAVTALRFAWQCLPNVPRERLAQSMRRLLDRPSFAASAIVDLARWRDLAARDAIVRLYDRPGEYQAATRRAAVGYLLACGDPPSLAALERLRAADPDGVAAAAAHYEKYGRLGIAAGQ
jgi:hypothetical protein